MNSFEWYVAKVAWLWVGMTLWLGTPARAAEPRIDYIEPFLSTQVLIHFDTDPNRVYELQYTDNLTTNGVVGGSWTNLFVAPSTPFPNHYIVVDTRLRPQRFYRLRVTP